jgi:taurine transport system ATP-binding protein
MDEPLGALDQFTRESVQELILQVWKKTQKLIFFITHSVEEALFMATRLLVLTPRPGKIIEDISFDFCHRYLECKDARKVKSSADFIKAREKILNLIISTKMDN